METKACWCGRTEDLTVYRLDVPIETVPLELYLLTEEGLIFPIELALCPLHAPRGGS